MEDLPETVFIEVPFSCQNEECGAYGIEFWIQVPEPTALVVCGPCGRESPIGQAAG